MVEKINYKELYGCKRSESHEINPICDMAVQFFVAFALFVGISNLGLILYCGLVALKKKASKTRMVSVKSCFRNQLLFENS